MIHPKSSLAGSAAALLVLLAASRPLAADTVHMKNGGLIKDARILREEGDTVHLRTPGGRMGVPRSAISRIEKGKSVFDEFDEMRAKVPRGDADRLFQVSAWCREKGLHEEELSVLEKVIEMKPNYLKARRRLGYYWKEGEWQKPPTLSICVRTKGPAEREEDVRGQLAIVLETRKDLVVVKDLEGVKPLDGCPLEVLVETTVKPRQTFFRQEIRGPVASAKVTLRAAADWAGKKPPELVAEGEVGAELPNAATLAVIDAFVASHREIHDFLDRVLGTRLARLEPPPAAKTPPAGPKAAGKTAGAKKAAKA
jgi:hypothetical protein